MLLAALFAHWIAPQNPYDLAVLDILDNRLPPGSESFSGLTYWLGTDDQGRDLYQRHSLWPSGPVSSLASPPQVSRW